MLKLINIKRSEATIEADYIPEDSEEKAHITLDIQTKQYEADVLPEYGAMYARMAANGLIKETDEPSPDGKRLVMWY